MRIPRTILFIGVPVLLGGALATAIVVAAAEPTGRPAAAAAAPSAPSVVTTPTPETETPGTEQPDPAETPETASANEPAGGGHSDEAPGSTTESNVDHQFEGNE